MVLVGFIGGVLAGGGFSLIVANARAAARPRSVIATDHNGLRRLAMRCSDCGIDWPHNRSMYARCPACLGPTQAICGPEVEPLDPGRARSIKLHHEFDRYCAARDQQ